MNNFRKGALILLLSAFGFSFMPIFAKFAYKGNINISTLLLFRFSIASVLLFICSVVKYKSIKVSKKDLFFLFILGGICYNLQARFYFSSAKYISASLAAVLLYTFPIIVTILSFIIYKEKITVKTGISILVSFVGLILIMGTSMGGINGTGIIFALGAALVYSTYIILGNSVIKNIPPLLTSAYVTMFSTAGVLSLSFMSGGIRFDFSISVWLPILGLALFSTVIAILTFFKGMELTSPSNASILSMMEPVFTVILSCVLLNDKLTLLQLSGGVLVLGGALFTLLTRKSDKA